MVYLVLTINTSDATVEIEGATSTEDAAHDLVGEAVRKVHPEVWTAEELSLLGLATKAWADDYLTEVDSPYRVVVIEAADLKFIEE